MALTILLHSSKTMVLTKSDGPLTIPHFIKQAQEVRSYVNSLSLQELQKSMHISEKLSLDVQKQFLDWKTEGSKSAAIETFRGDIYSGLRSLEFTESERAFAQQHLYLLSGLYGLLRPYDEVSPYRLEAGYRFAKEPFNNMYTYWGAAIAQSLPANGDIVNVTSAEYDALVLPHIDTKRVVTPKFLSIMSGASEPKFVAVHAKIARGAYARWLIQRGRDDLDNPQEFTDLGYAYDASLSSPKQPVYICTDFKGIGLSQRLV